MFPKVRSEIGSGAELVELIASIFMARTPAG